MLTQLKKLQLQGVMPFSADLVWGCCKSEWWRHRLAHSYIETMYCTYGNERILMGWRFVHTLGEKLYGRNPYF